MKLSYSTTLFAIILAVIFSSYYLTQDRPIKYDLIIERIEGSGPAQLFCNSGKGYSGKYHTLFPYSEKHAIGDNLYRYKGQISCEGKAETIRFDFLAGSGKVIIKSIGIRTFRWIDLDLETINNTHLRALNAIDSFNLTNDGLEIKASGNDPHVQILKDIQSFRKVGTASFIAATLLFSILFYILLRISIFSWVSFVNSAKRLESARLKAAKVTDHLISSMGSYGANTIKQPTSINLIVFSASLVIASIANNLFIKHIYQSYSSEAISAFIAAELRIITFLLISSFIIGLLEHFRRLQTSLQSLILLASLVYLADALLYRINGMHVSHGIGMLLDGGVQNFFRNLKYTKLTQLELTLYPIFLLVVIVLTYFIAHISVITKRFRQPRISNIALLFIALILTAGFIGEQKLSNNYKSSRLYAIEQQEMPIYPKFYGAKSYLYSLDIKLKEDQRDSKNKVEITPLKERNIYLFILESVRQDVTTPDVTPNLNLLRQNSLEFTTSIADGNATHYGWYSIVNSQFPLHWEKYRNSQNILGSKALSTFKQAGYKINIHSAKDLNYLDSKRIMFGGDDKVYDYLSPVTSHSAPHRDSLVTQQLIRTIEKSDSKQPSLNIIFYDSTHYPYTWPDDYPTKFEPVAGKPTAAISLNTARDLSLTKPTLIINRYKNSINFTDSLIGKVVSSLKKSQLYEKSIIVAVGDHGQQFMEHNFLMHGKSLFNEDLNIPLIIKIPEIKKSKRYGVASQIDIMPTLLDAVGLTSYISSVSDGTSLLRNSRKHQFAISAAAGIQNTPFNMILKTEKGNLLFDLEKRAPLSSKKLYIKGLQTPNDEEFIPGNGNLVDYRNYINKYFLPYLQETHLLQLQ